MSPRLRQTLLALLAGDGEKQIARRLRISPHTVHVYVKALYRRFEVSSRGELLARFVAPAMLDAEADPPVQVNGVRGRARVQIENATSSTRCARARSNGTHAHVAR